MDYLTFTSHVVESIASLAWPAAAVIVALLFRRVVQRKLHHITKVKHKGLEIEFEKELDAFSEKAQPLEQAIEVNGPQSGSGMPYYSGSGSGSGGAYDLMDGQLNDARRSLIQLVDVAPWAVVIDGWNRVEAKLKQLIVESGYHPERSKGGLVKQAIDHQLVGPTIANLLRDFSSLRNKAAHLRSDEISRETALQYIDWTIKLVAALDINSEARRL